MINDQTFTLELNSVIVLESLEGERNSDKTGTLVFNEIIQYFPLKQSNFKGKVHHLNSLTKEEFISNLMWILEQTKIGFSPIIHIECHGANNGKGLVISPTNELVTWDEIFSITRAINIIMKNSLIITMGVCHGAHIQNAIDFKKEAPFFTLIGSYEVLYSDEIYKGFSSFFKEFLLELDVLNAFKKIKDLGVFKIYSVEVLFEIFQTQFNNDLKKASRKYGRQLLLNKIQRNPKDQIVDKYEAEIEEKVKLYRSNLINEFRNIKENYLMLNKYPEIESKFNN